MDNRVKLLEELQSRAHLSSYQKVLAWNYIKWAYAIGYEECDKNFQLRGKNLPVQQLKDGIEINRFKSVSDAAKSIHVTQGSISKVINGKRKFIKGFKFKIIHNETN